MIKNAVIIALLLGIIVVAVNNDKLRRQLKKQNLIVCGSPSASIMICSAWQDSLRRKY